MRIAIFHNHPSGGAARAVFEMGKRLAERHDIDVFTLSMSDEGLLRSQDYAMSVDVETFEPATPVRMGLYLNDWRQYRTLQRLDKTCAEIARRIDGREFDVVLASACGLMNTPAVLPHLSTPSVYYCHEPPRRFVQAECRTDAGPLRAYERLRSAWHAPAQQFVASAIRRYDRRNFAAAGSVLTNSRFTAKLVHDYYGRRADVCQLGVDATKFLPSVTTAGSYVLSVGALEYHKGFDFIVRGLGRVGAEDRPRFVIVANTVNPGVREHLLEVAAGEGVNVELRSRVSDDELVKTYQGAAVFAYAPHGEPFGLAVLEAMACGLPVVAVAEGGVIESVEHGVTGVTIPRNEDRLASALFRLLNEPDRARQWGRAGRAAVECRWTWEAASDRLERSLERAAAGATAKRAHA